MNNKQIAIQLVRLAKALAAGCEKLPEGPMRDNCEKKKEEGKKDASLLNRRAATPFEMSPRELNKFLDYFMSFHSESQGLYPIHGLNKKDVLKALDILVKERPDHDFAGDSFDRELVRDIVLRWRKMLPKKKSSERVAALKWREMDDSKGHRWNAMLGDYGAHVVEFEGPGIPLYRIMLAMPDGDALKYNKQVKKLEEAKKIAENTLKALDDDSAGGVNLTREWRQARVAFRL